MEVPSSLYLAVLYGTFLSLLLGYGSLGCLEEEKVGLLQLKASINHPNGTALSSWGGEVGDCCRWEKVACDNKTNRVIRLSLWYIRDFDLGEWSLNASLLLPFQQLQILELYYNRLAGIQGLLRLKKLRVLNVGGNDLTTIPILSALPSLEVLDLNDNYINSSQLQGLKYLSRLEVLNLEYNLLMGGIPPIIGTLGYLKALSLGNNNLNDSFSMEGTKRWVIARLFFGREWFCALLGWWEKAWTDDLMKKMVHAELHDYGDFGLADVQEDEREEDAHEDPGNPVNEVEEEITDEIIVEYNAVKRQIHQLLRTMRGAIDKLAKRQNTNKTPSSSHQSRSHNQPDINDSFPSPPHAYGSSLNDRFVDGEDNVGPSTSQPAAQHSIEDEVQMNAIIPYETGHPPIRSYRLRRHATALQSPYVVQPSIKFSASSSVAKQVLAYALDDTRDESQILCSMHNFFLTRFDLKCLGPDKLVDNKLFIPICRKNHWYLIILNIHAKRIELLDSLIDRRKKRMDAFIEKLVNVLSTVIGIKERRPSVDMTEFEFVVPEVVQQLNPTDCGIFVIKFMQLWSNDGLSRAIANDKVIKYKEKLLTQLIMSPENEVRENVYQAMDQ